MNTIKFIVLLFLASLFYFPFNPSIAPAVNTKMVIAAMGLMWFIVKNAKSRRLTIDLSMFSISISAIFVSVIGLCSVVINNTSDYAYASYIISAWVWIGGAYAVVEYTRIAFGTTTLRLITNALIFVCVIQCILSQIIAGNAAVANWVDSIMASSGFMGKAEGRLYGIGCALDVAGLKFSCVMLLLAHFVVHPSGKINKRIEVILYIVAYGIIAIFGSMISRTTGVGIFLSIVYWLVIGVINKDDGYAENMKVLLQTILMITIIAGPILVYEYNHNSLFYNNIRFGFEGLFSLFETGEWSVRSNDQLNGMWIWPDNFKTWCIGDGYFGEHTYDPNYIGPNPDLPFYMGTDIGYCRFVFYFGVIGLIAFSFHFINCFWNCANNIPSCKLLFLFLLFVNFVGWIKVSSDIFPIFALILALGSEPSIQDNREDYIED